MTNKHDFFDFMKSAQDWMAQEYTRIQKRTQEDPGTAGDQAEENWATLFRNWLPANYPVVTKGRIISAEGIASPQVDVIILHPSYPISLRDKKVYFAGGVVAAFECKLTLRRTHIKKAIKNAILIKNMVPARTGNIYEELHQPIIFGLLAHSQEVIPHDVYIGSKMVDKIDSCAIEVFNDLPPETQELGHPRYLMDLICIADLTNIVLTKTVLIGRTETRLINENIADYEYRIENFPDSSKGIVLTSYTNPPEVADKDINMHGHILGSLIFTLTSLLAFEDASLRSLAGYLARTEIWAGVGAVMNWQSGTLSESVVSRVTKEGYEEDEFSKWKQHY